MEATMTAQNDDSSTSQDESNHSSHPLPAAPSTANDQEGQMPGAQLRRIRNYLDMSLTRFGEVIGRSRQWISHYEKGRKPIPASVADRALRLWMREALKTTLDADESNLGEDLVMDVVRLYNAAKNESSLSPHSGGEVITHRARKILESTPLDVPKDIGVAMVVSVVTTLSLVPEPHEY